MVRSCGVWAVLGAVLWTVPASGAECGSAGRPWVKVTFASSFGTAAVQARIVEDFRAGLSDRAIDVCGGASLPSRPALAGVHIAATTATRVGVSVEVRDALTEKRLTRDVDLSSVPEDGKAFAVAVAADELLRASWVELALEREGRLPRKPPREVVEIVNSTLSRSTNARTARLGVRGAAERFTGGQTHYGADAALVVELVPRLQWDAALGAREALTVSAPGGRVHASAAGVASNLGYLLVRNSSFEVSVRVGCRLAWVRFRGEAEAAGTGGEFKGLSMYSRLGLGAAMRLGGPVWADLESGVGAPLRALAAQDALRTVTAVSGAELAVRAGLSVEF